MPSSEIFFEKNIFKAITIYSIPVLLSLFLQALYGAVDLWAVGQFSHFYDISAVAIASEFMMIVTQFISGFLTATTVLLSSKVGSGDKNAERNVTIASVILFTIIGVIFSIVITAFAPFFADLMNTPSESKSGAIAYLRISGAGTLFIVYYNLISAIFRALGDSKSPFIFVSIAAVVNIIGDVVLTHFLHMGTSGVAIATISSQAISVIVSYFYLRRVLKSNENNKADEHEKKSLMYKELVKIGLPLGLQASITELSYAIVISFGNTFGVVASSGIGVATKIIMFIYLIPVAFTQTTSVFTSSNCGKGDTERAKKCLWMATLIATVLGFIAAVVLFFFGDKLSLLFTSEAQVIAASHDYLKVCAVECFLLSFVYCLLGYFNGIGRTKFVVIVSLLPIFLVKIPYAYYAAFIANPSVANIAVADALSSILQFIMTLCYYFAVRTKKIPILLDENSKR